MSRIRSAAEGLKSSGIRHQEEVIKTLGLAFQNMQKIYNRINEMIFEGCAFDTYRNKLESNYDLVEDHSPSLRRLVFIAQMTATPAGRVQAGGGCGGDQD